MAVKTRKWDEIYNNLDALTQEDRDEIALKVKIIGQILEARKEKGLTQAELEAISGVKQTFIARLENNRMDPQLTTILKLLHPLGMTLTVVPLKEQPKIILRRRRMDCAIKSLYLCVVDMDRAIAFYENLLEQTVTVRDDIYSVFDINGFRLGLFAYQKMNEQHTFGNNCLPSLGVNSIDVLKNKLSKLKTIFPLKQIGENWVAEFEDSEGNHIEITAPVKHPE